MRTPKIAFQESGHLGRDLENEDASLLRTLLWSGPNSLLHEIRTLFYSPLHGLPHCHCKLIMTIKKSGNGIKSAFRDFP